MRTIRATCPLCTDEVDLKPDQITLHLLEPGSPTGNRYGFECPRCEVFVVKPAGLNAVELLLEGGVELSTAAVAPWEARPSHPEDPPAGPALTHDDLIDLHLLLQTDDWFASLLEHVR